jgi:outer membrane immunogenic protein
MRYFGNVLVCASILGFACAPAAHAADMPRKAPKAAAVTDPWSGWYGGVTIGGADHRSCQTLNPEGIIVTPGFEAFSSFISGLGTGCATSLGVIGGGEVGINQRSGQWVWGLEADANALSGKTTRTSAATFPGGADYVSNNSSKVNFLATVRPRLGMIVHDNTLAYVTGGFAVANVYSSGGLVGDQAPPTYNSFGSIASWVPGWVVGAGIETKLGGPWSVKAEYLYVDLNAVHYNTSQQTLFFSNFVETMDVPTNLQIFRLGLNYKFGDPTAAHEAYASAAAAREAYASAAAAVHDWTGFYAGAHFGGAWGKTRAHESDTEVEPGAGNWNAFGDTFEAKTSGIVGGVQAGYNWQMNSIVTGVEADLGYLGFKGQASSSLAPDTIVSGTGGFYGTLRGRLGYAWDRALLYATGGLMVADLGTSVNDVAFVPNPGIIYTDKTHVQAGWTVGGGVEYALARGWSVKGEYLHFDLGSKRVYGIQENFGPPNTYAWDIKNSGDIVRIGFNRKL